MRRAANRDARIFVAVIQVFDGVEAGDHVGVGIGGLAPAQQARIKICYFLCNKITRAEQLRWPCKASNNYLRSGAMRDKCLQANDETSCQFGIPVIWSGIKKPQAYRDI